MQKQGSEHFWRKIKGFSKSSRSKILKIVLESKKGTAALNNYQIPDSILPVRNKNSENVDKNDPDFIAKVKFAQANNLWHIHAGFYNIAGEYPIYDGYKESTKKVDLVSQWMLHYSVTNGSVKFHDATTHPLDIYSIQIS